MGLSHGFQAHFVNNANYSTLTTEEKLTLFNLVFSSSPLESTALTTQDQNFSKHFFFGARNILKIVEILSANC